MSRRGLDGSHAPGLLPSFFNLCEGVHDTKTCTGVPEQHGPSHCRVLLVRPPPARGLCPTSRQPKHCARFESRTWALLASRGSVETRSAPSHSTATLGMHGVKTPMSWLASPCPTQGTDGMKMRCLRTSVG